MDSNKQVSLSDFDVSPTRGFLPEEDPLMELPPDLEFLDQVGNELPELIESKKILTVAKTLPILSDDYFTRFNKRELMLAWVRCSHILNANVHSQTTSPKLVCWNLAKLAYAISKELEVYPILQYFPYVLNNWKKKNQQGPIKVDNLELIQMFLRIPEQSWFNLIHVDIENEAGLGISNLWEANLCVEHDPIRILEFALLSMKESITSMIATMKRMPEGTFPDTYHRIRPWIMSFENVIYEGVNEYNGQPQTFRGQTGAQTSIFQALEAGMQMPRLSENKLSIHLFDMRKYMLPKHREFIEYLEANSKVREFILSSVPHLIDLYDECVFNILTFLAIHLGYAFFYIHQKTANPKGTGGTDFMDYLGERIKERWERGFIKPRTEDDFKIFTNNMRKTVKELVGGVING
ncbi:MAG: hypothetical protein Q8Q89_00165 [bacterium]|nr:hypothetical protein [bacterium]